jgi:glucose/arabinose dehydrogenase
MMLLLSLALLVATPLPTPGPSTVLQSRLVPVPAEQVPVRAAAGLRVALFAEGLSQPREMAQLADGSLLVVERSAGGVRRLVDGDGDGRAEVQRAWADGLTRPYGILVRDGWAYVGMIDGVVRFRIAADGSAGERQAVVPRLELDGRVIEPKGHWTRDVLFSRDGRQLFVSVGSRSNNDDDPPGRAAILVYDVASGATADAPLRVGPPRVFASGLRNPVGLAWRPGSDELWTAVNERDALGDDLVPDFVTSVRAGGFYGWPFYYIGANQDPRWAGARPALAAQVLVPDVLLQAHAAALGLAFYEGTRLPERYRGGLFVGLHGSWNRNPLVGYAVAFVPFAAGRPSGPAEDVVTGFVKDASSGEVYGRPVAPYVAADGSLLISDDLAGRIWRVTD